MNFSEILSESSVFNNIYEKIDRLVSPIDIKGVSEAVGAHLISTIYKKSNRRTIVVCYSDLEASQLYKDLKFYTDTVYKLPTKELVLYNVDALGRENEHKRISTIYNWEKGGILVASVESIIQYTIPKDVFEKNRIRMSVGECFNIDELSNRLVDMGYSRNFTVEGTGQFSVRGGIVDVFSPNSKYPLRVEFFDDEVDSIRYFDWETQRSLENADNIEIIPCIEAIMNSEQKSKLFDLLTNLNKQFPEDEAIASEMNKLGAGSIFSSIDKYIYTIYGRIPNISEYIEDDLVFITEPKRIWERIKTYLHDKYERIFELTASEILKLKDIKYYADEKIFYELLKKQVVALDILSCGLENIDEENTFEIASKSTVSFHGKLDYLYDDLRNWIYDGYTIVILAHSKDKRANVYGVLTNNNFDCEISDTTFTKGKINVCVGNLSKGFSYPDLKFVVISDREIFEGNERRKKRKIDNSKRIKSYNDITPGDYVVHQLYGVGVYNGIHKMRVDGVNKDYLKVSYKDNDVLYIPINQLDLLFKYPHNEDKPVKINKLGNSDWSKTTRKAKKSTQDMAKQLIELYAKRQNSKGFAFSKDTVWQRDFEDAFVYSETEDQLRSIEEVKTDMESQKPMERLLCGDVGFGKTEVALRAAFKAVMDSKQVAYLCPTTILAMQQYNTFTERMGEFPVKVEMLSRFRTEKQQRSIIKKLKDGEIDIIIGTHRLIQKDVVFHDLGLLIIDEEQRFGVAAKERLKELRSTIDVLSMTATPIPRTLHMSMISIRDMSVLTEPPENRYPVETYVMEENPIALIDAIKHELARGGQVFYLHNRIQGIYRIAEWLKANFPDHNVDVGHGRMSEDELEDVMHRMVSGDTDILVCTTIIETGLDIPNANTMIIDDADKMGLSQLYQLRGRVGRSNRVAYAYFIYQRGKSLSEVAEKRLSAIKEFTEFGSGFKIALKDLEIRGAGDLLGSSQHGHMDALGYDLYCKMLNESIKEAKGEKVEIDFVTTIDFNIDAYIPESYINDSSVRIEIYKKIAAIENSDDADDIVDELIDRYGDPPRAALNVIDVAILKAKAKKCGISDVMQKPACVIIKFVKFDPIKLIDICGRSKGLIKIVPGDTPTINLKINNKQNIIKEVGNCIDML